MGIMPALLKTVLKLRRYCLNWAAVRAAVLMSRCDINPFSLQI